MTISREKALEYAYSRRKFSGAWEAAKAARLAPVSMEGVVIVGSGGNPLVDGFPRLISIDE